MNFISFKRWGLGCLLAVGLAIPAIALTTPSTMTFQATLSSQREGLLQGRRSVIFSFYDGPQSLLWTQTIPAVQFVGGSFSVILGTDARNPLSERVFAATSPNLQIQVEDLISHSFSVPSVFVLSSTPYAVQSRIADTVTRVSANQIVGSFTSTLNVAGDVIFGTRAFVVRSNLGSVGVGTANPSALYKLDVAGLINARGFRVNGQDLETSLSWKKGNNNTLFYNTGFVGVGTSAPQYSLDVAGTINAREYKIDGISLDQRFRALLAWKDGAGQDIYFDDGSRPSQIGRVGIGTSEPTERLDVRGALRLGTSLSSPPNVGTIQYTNGDFQGYTAQGWRSLTGIQGNGVVNQLTYWADTKTLAGSDKLVWVNNKLAVGTSNPTARLDIVMDSGSTAGLDVRSATGSAMLYVTQSKVGVGTSSPQQTLDVNGVINASNYLINGKPLGQTFSTDSFWLRENDSRIYYDAGNVGIGTNSPQSLLELSSTAKDPSITFDIGGVNLFTMGVSSRNTDAFVIAKGGNLSVPVFTFQGDQIGVGTGHPSANLQVSGNSGVVFSGVFGSGTSLPESGPGTKLIWYPAKSAFRVGRVLNDEWDQANLGNYSVGMGFNPIATGEGSVVAGGYKNTARGNNAFVAGGINNSAIGENSFAAGHSAQALHRGSFVWADYTVPTSNFSSTVSNQFIIRAANGVGIGTSNTLGASLTVARSGVDYLFRAFGRGAKPVMVVTPSGNVGIGTTAPGNAKLTVMGGSVGIGTSEPPATMTIRNPIGSTKNIMVVYPSDATGQTPTAALVITAAGSVGIGVTSGYRFGGEKLTVNGVVKAAQFLVVDPNDPSKTIIIQPNPGSPWSVDQNNNTYRTMGKVGIGTPSPNSLLTLSDRGPSHNIPAITFDSNGIRRYTIGITPNATRSGYVFVVSPGGALSTTPSLTISTSSVGIGTRLARPRSALDVSGNILVSGNVLVATTNPNSLYRVQVGGGFNTRRLFIAGTEFVPVVDPWSTNGSNIYYNGGNVGIGISNPQYSLVVRGTVSANSLVISRPITLGADLIASRLLLKDSNSLFSAPRYGQFRVTSGNFIYVNPDGISRVISSPLQRGTGTTGTLAFWVDPSTLGITTATWDGPTSTLTVSGDVKLTRFRRAADFRVTSNAKWGGQTAFDLSSNLAHDGDSTLVKGYTAESVAVNINSKWGNSLVPVQVKGADISMKTSNGSFLLNNAQAIGLMVDVSSVNVSTIPSDRGSKYAAIFKGGNVGIGTTTPRAELEVAGTVSANYFNLSGGLTVPQLTVARSAFVAKSVVTSGGVLPRVGIGITDPENSNAEFTVRGMVSANALTVANGITAVTANIGNNTFVVDATGNIGIGTSRPIGQMDIQKIITGVMTADQISQKIDVSIDGAPPGNIFFLNRNITGVDMALRSAGNNRLSANATGIKLDMSALNLNAGSKAVGLDVNVTGTTGTRYAAIFRGGRVGIGTTTPGADLDVVGTINATNLYLRSNLQSNRATFNYLTVNTFATFNGTVSVNNLIVRGTITANSLVLGSTLVAPDAIFATLNASTVSVNGLLRTRDLRVTRALTGQSALFTGGVGIGVTTAPLAGLKVSGNISTDTLEATSQLRLTNATLNVGTLSGTTYFMVTRGGKVGIGTSVPSVPLHVQSTTARVYSAADTSTWGVMKIQSQSNAVNTGAGLLFIPDNIVSTSTVGSGIVGIRASDSLSQPSSHLAFITDPISGVPQERLRITEAGNVGIGTTVPSALLDVNGSVRVSGNLTVDGAFSISKLVGINGLIITPNGLLEINNGVSVNQSLTIGKATFIKAGSAPTVPTGYGALFVDSSDNNLYFIKPGTTLPISLTGGVLGTAGRVPYINTDGNLKSDAPIFWNATTKRFTVGTFNVMTGVDVGVTLNNSAVGNLTGQRVRMAFADRSGLTGTQTSVFTGMDIQMTGSNPSDLSNFGRLGSNETAIGLKVDVRTLKALQFDSGGGSTQGVKYAAQFLGGNVGIGTETPQAALHVASELASVPALRVDLLGTANAFVVTSNGYVGVGLAKPTSRFTIQADGTDSARSAFNVQNSSGTSMLFVRNDGRVGIGTTTPAAALHVIGTVSANVGTFGTATATTLNIGNGNFFVNASGNIGIGTTQPKGNLSFNKLFTSTTLPTTDFTSQKIQLSVGETLPNTQFTFTKNLTGLDVNLASLSGSTVGTALSPAIATGVSVNLTAVQLGTGSKAVGVFVDVTGTTGVRHSAVFMGGNVGIGVRNPGVALDVNGDVRATSLQLSGSLTASAVTFNTLVVSQAATLNGTVTANKLVANAASVNILIVKGTLDVATGSFNVIKGTKGIFTTLGVGTNVKPTRELEVLGDAYISKTVTVNGSLASPLLRSISTINITAPAGVVVNGGVSMNSGLLVGGGVGLRKQSQPGTSTTLGQIYVDTAGQLNYLKPGSTTPVQLSSSGTPGKVPYFDNTGNLSSSANITWTSGTNTLKVGTGSMTINTAVPNTVYASGMAAEDINMTFGDRSGLAATSKFVGLNIALTGQNPSDPFNFGRLGRSEEAVGLRVDLSSVRAKYTSAESLGADSTVLGYKYAAVFVGGNVGIGTTAPAAGLHVQSSAVSSVPFRVDTVNTQNALVVNSAGYVGIGTSAPGARLAIKASNTAGGLLNLQDNSGTSVVFMKADGRMGINTTLPSANIHVVGVSTTPLLRVDTTVATALTVNPAGLLGIGTVLPSASVHVIGNGTTAPLIVGAGSNANALFVEKTGLVGMGTSTPLYPLSVNGIVMAGTPNVNTGAQIRVPSWLLNTVLTNRGFLANNNTDNLFFGVRPRTSGTGSDAVLWWGNAATDAFNFEYYNGTVTTNIMTMKGTGMVLISTRNTVPSASVHIIGKSPFIVETPSDKNLFVVSSNGYVGIKTRLPSANLHVVGTVMATTMKVLQGSLQVSTLNVLGSLSVIRNVTVNMVATGQAIVMKIGSDMNSDVAALDVKLDALNNPLYGTSPSSGRSYTVYNGAQAIGLRVDVSGVEVRDPVLRADDKPGYKVAAAFLGGDVGIGPDTNFRPAYPLHVQSTLQTVGGSTFVDIARLGSNQGDLTLRDFGSGSMGFFSRTTAMVSPQLGLVMTPASTGGASAQLGRIGIGITNPDKTLVVNGDVRLGVVREAGVVESSGPGSALYFSGGPDLSASKDSNNGGELFIRRFNRSVGASELQVGLGTSSSATSNRFMVGYSTDATGTTFKSILDVRANGKVGISDGQDATFSPQNMVHVKGSYAGASDQTNSYVMLVEDAGAKGSDAMAIYNSNLTSSRNANFVSFFRGNSWAGAIQSNPDLGGGVRYMTQGADYAEYLPKTDPKESIDKGDIVGIVNGKVSKNTQGAQQVMVRSSAASVAGNWPGQENVHNFALVSFFGQVPVKVVGPVHKGDYIVPSEANDGTGVAVAPQEVSPEKIHLIVGTAWEGSDKMSVKLIHTAVGFHFSLPNMSRTASDIATLEKKVQDLKVDRERMMKGFDQKLEDQNRQIQALMDALK